MARYGVSKDVARVLLPKIDGGVIIDGGMLSGTRDDVCKELINMWSDGGFLTSRPGLYRPFGCPPEIAGSLHSISGRSFFGSILFHCGGVLAAFDGTDEPHVLLNGLDDCDSFFCEINSVAYLFTKTERIYSVSKNLSAEEIFPYVPRIIKNATPNLSSYEADEDFNLLSRKITVRYSHNAYYRSFTLPFPADTSETFTAVIDDEKRLSGNSCAFSADGKAIIISSGNSGKYIDFTYTISKNSEAYRAGMIFGCRFSECFGGTTMEGTRLFLSGNPDYPGHCFRSGLLNPTYFKDLDFDIIGNGNDVITAFSKQYGDLLVFTERSVGRIVYSFSDEGAEFRVREINSRIGCDMPRSVALIDNRTVFANKSGGVFVIDSTDNTDEMNIVPISGNILGKSNGNGLLSESNSEKENCTSIDFGCKYYLFIGSHAYVWDYSSSPYFSQRKGSGGDDMTWYLFGSTENVFCFEVGGKLWLFRNDSNSPAAFSDDCTDDFGEPTESRFVTKSLDLSQPHLMKKLKSVRLTLKCHRDARVRLKVYADEKEIYSHDFSCGSFSWRSFHWDGLTLDSSEGYKSIELRLPPYKANRYAVGLESIRGRASVGDIEWFFAKTF